MRIAPVLFLVTGCGIFGVGAQTATAVAVNAAEAACLLAHATEGTDAARAACGIDPGRPAVQIIITPEARCLVTPAKDAGSVSLHAAAPLDVAGMADALQTTYCATTPRAGDAGAD